MVPVSLLCKGFLKALVAADRPDQSAADDDVQIVENYRLNDEANDDDIENDKQLQEIVESRRMYLNQSIKAAAKRDICVTEQLNTEKLLKRLMKKNVTLML